MVASSAQLLALIDSYAAARAARERLDALGAAGWAFVDAHRAMLAARAAVADALGVTDAAPMPDPLAGLAAFAETRWPAAGAAHDAEAVAR